MDGMTHIGIIMEYCFMVTVVMVTYDTHTVIPTMAQLAPLHTPLLSLKLHGWELPSDVTEHDRQCHNAADNNQAIS